MGVDSLSGETNFNFDQAISFTAFRFDPLDRIDDCDLNDLPVMTGFLLWYMQDNDCDMVDMV